MAATWPGGVGMFVVPCYDKVTRELTTYISSGKIDEGAADVIEDVPRFAELAGITVEQAQALRDNMDVSTESWQDHCARIGVTPEPADD